MTSPVPENSGASSAHFDGFEPIDANYVYCPNQFFDVCLPHYSRGVVRLVAFMLRQTLGFRDKDGNPLQQDISISYRDFIRAGISRGAIRPTIDEAIQAGFIACVQQGAAKTRGTAAQTARYRLRWGSSDAYVTDPQQFSGFFAGTGNRSPVPNGFFDTVVPRETLAVVKVVGTVLRYTVGYENQFGRRPQAPLSYSYIQRYAKMADRNTLATAIEYALQTGYIRCVDPGRFSSDISRQKPATYAVKWLEKAITTTIGSETLPASVQKPDQTIGSETLPDPKTPDRFRNPTSIGSETRPAQRFKNPTKEITSKNKTSKQQSMPQQPTGEEGTAAADQREVYSLLRKAGFDDAAAEQLSQSHPAEEVRQQVAWIDVRQPERNRLGMLRRAIEQRWPAPDEVRRQQEQQRHREQQEAADLARRAEEAALAEQKRVRSRQRAALLAEWGSLDAAQRRFLHETAIRRATSDFVRQRLRRHRDLSHPPVETLDMMARTLVTMNEPS